MKAQKKHQYILEQAYKVFIKKGYSQVTMTDIITECEISRGGVYRYFQSTKDIFYRACSANELTEIRT
ncbi:TetR family transcriptional regulator [Xenorhabdus cabanillasii]|uniref:TetR family transcriptional regulator n=1 Tax=Xenorhabdus cabanillasii TaxID=351673 RepID=A0A3D9UJ84_9GAMM|nr:helix-turn-helix domain-containing protein [Xenorhabdus cabanillasii]REF28010.1 TetR family transcriptional regulator [Xenorhabdus cabanillasii]